MVGIGHGLRTYSSFLSTVGRLLSAFILPSAIGDDPPFLQATIQGRDSVMKYSRSTQSCSKWLPLCIDEEIPQISLTVQVWSEDCPLSFFFFFPLRWPPVLQLALHFLESQVQSKDSTSQSPWLHQSSSSYPSSNYSQAPSQHRHIST